MRSHIISPALQLLRTPLAEPGDDRLARELLELCRYEPDLHISSLHIAASILRAHDGLLALHRGTLVGAVFLYPRSAGWLEIGTLKCIVATAPMGWGSCSSPHLLRGGRRCWERRASLVWNDC